MRHDGVPRRRPRRRLDRRRAARRHAAAAARDARRARRHPRRQRQRGDAAHQRDRRPDRLRPGHPGARTGGCCASSSSATPAPDELDVHEVGTSIYAFRRDLLGPALRHLSPDNAQGEYYLTDVVGVLGGMGHRDRRVQAPADETQGVNDRWQLALAERELRARTNRHWLLNGVTMLDPRQTFIDVTVRARPRRHAVPGHDPAGQHGRRRRLRDRARHPARRLRRRARTAASQHTVGRDAEIGDGAPGRAVRPPAGRDRRSPRRRDRRVLHCTQRVIGQRDASTGRAADGEGHHQEAGALLGPHPSRAGRRRSPPTSASSSATRTSSSSPTARSGPGSARASAATTCSSCRATTASTARSVNDSIMEQLIMIDAAYRASAKRITAVCPFYGYARQDRKAEGREPITARLVADMFKAAGAKRMISIDLHAGQIQGFFDGPVDHLTAMPVLEDYVREHADGAGDRVARRRAHQGRRADGPAPRRLRRRPGVHLQAPAEGHGQRRRGERGASATSRAACASSPTT